MALPSKKVDSKVREPSKLALVVADGLSKGLTGPQIAKKLANGDPKKAKILRAKIRDMAYKNNGDLKLAVARQAEGDLLLGVNGTLGAVVRRAHRGRMDAARVVLEASGFHNPRIKHEHSGEVTVKLEMPRPKFEQDLTEPDPIVDADVVDD